MSETSGPDVAQLWRDMEGARELVADYLTAAIPLVAEMMAEAGTPLERIPAEAIQAAPPEPRAEHYPAVNVVGLDVVQVVPIDVDGPTGPAPAVPSLATPNPGTGVVYWVTYGLRVWHRVRGQEYADTVTQRDRLGKAIRLALLADLALGTTDGRAMIDPTSVVSSYSDVGRLGSSANRSVAAAWTGLRVRLEETLPYTTLGVAGTLSVSPSLLPHPALS